MLLPPATEAGGETCSPPGGPDGWAGGAGGRDRLTGRRRVARWCQNPPVRGEGGGAYTSASEESAGGGADAAEAAATGKRNPSHSVKLILLHNH